MPELLVENMYPFNSALSVHTKLKLAGFPATVVLVELVDGS